jgi:hypothetical protein
MRHTIAIATAGLMGGCLLAWSSVGRAQEISYVNQPIAAPSNAFELKVGTGYTQGFGNLTPGQRIADVATAGIGVNLDADYRMNPRWSVGLQGEYQEFQNNRANNFAARGLAANVGVTYHGAPFVHGDPWLRLGAGYRGLWSVSAAGGPPSTLVHGFEIAKATLGYDIRVSQSVAIAPLVGADVNAFVAQNQGGVNSMLPVSSAQVGTFVFAGVQGRFDMGGTTTATPTVASP